jgi:putative ABC transport system permease protein
MIAMMFDMLDASIAFIVILILLVAGMGISNSFLMNIMGRMPEFGVMRAMGLSGKQMFAMILSESFVLGVIGSIAGLIPGVGLVYYKSNRLWRHGRGV